MKFLMMLEGDKVVIPLHLSNRSLYHFTHLRNLTGILEYGLLSKNKVQNLGIDYRNIAYEGIQERRDDMKVPCGSGGCIHDYVPLYFCKRSPMLNAVVSNKISDEQYIIYLEFPIEILEQLHGVFSDHSANTEIPPTFYDDTSQLVNLDWNAIDTWRWGSRHDIEGCIPVRRKKQAEALFYRSLGLEFLKKIVVWDDNLKKFVETKFEKYGIVAPKITCEDYYYYMDETKPLFVKGKYTPRSGTREPSVTGPDYTYKKYTEIAKNVAEKIGSNESPKYANLFELRSDLRSGLDCIPETLELIGLSVGYKDIDPEVEYDKDVATHTEQVVNELVKTQEFLKMDRTDKLLVEIAAYLHDIGRGPKNRFNYEPYKRRSNYDHPLESLQMMERILTEDVGVMKIRSAKMICKLVCYHDLIQGIISKGRTIGELKRIVTNEKEFNMLIALTKADMDTFDPFWSVVNKEKIRELKEEMPRV